MLDAARTDVDVTPMQNESIDDPAGAEADRDAKPLTPKWTQKPKTSATLAPRTLYM